MSFISYEFLGFLFVVAVLYYTIFKNKKWELLLISSYYFYYKTGVGNLLFIVLTSLLTYIFSLVISENNKANLIKEKQNISIQGNQKERRKVFLLIFALFLLFMLFIGKYTDVASNFTFFIQKKRSSFLIPLGISFYILQSIGYLIDSYKGKVEIEKNFFKLSLFITFFPQLIEGPISRFKDLKEELFKYHNFKYENIKIGIIRILYGLFKKLIIAERIEVFLDEMCLNPEKYQGPFVFITLIVYSVYIYCDFTGGIDIALGVAKIFDIKLTENFNHPYFSKSLREFWRRWHITMGTWFKDYVFYPMSVSKNMLILSKKSRKLLGDRLGKRVPVFIAIFVTWALTGLWHGLSINFFLWGIFNAIFIIIEEKISHLYEKNIIKNKNLKLKVKFVGILKILYTFILVSLLRIFDCYRDYKLAFKMFLSMFNLNKIKEFNSKGLSIYTNLFSNIDLKVEDIVLIILGVFTIFLYSIISKKQRFKKKGTAFIFEPEFIAFFCLFISVILFGKYGKSYIVTDFVYGRF